MKAFFIQMFATAAGMLLFSVAVGILLFGFVFFVAMGQAPLPHERGALLTLDLSQPISDRGELPATLGLFGMDGRALALADVVDALRTAAQDDSISGLLLHGSPQLSWAMLRELREAVLEFQSDGKPAYAFFTTCSEPELYLASAAEQTRVAPLSLVSLNGLAAEVLYFGDALAKLGFEFQSTRAGRFKSAVEPYTSSQMSSENRQQLEALLGSLSETFVVETSAGLGLAPDDLRRIASEQPFLSAEEAVRERLFDEVASFDVLLNELRDNSGESRDGSTFAQVSMRDYLGHAGLALLSGVRSGDVAVVYAEGDILDGDVPIGVGGTTLSRELRELRRDDGVRAIVLRVNSPGGSVTASQAILDEVLRLREAGKPVVVSMGGVAASGGYWIASEADAIVAEPNTITGSIGVFFMWPNGEEAMRKLGLSAQIVKTAPYADALSFFRRKSERELDMAQRHVDAAYEEFIDHVARGRRLDRGAVENLAQGRVWTGAQALELGLVDELGGLQRALDLAADKAGLGDDYTVSYPVIEKRPLDALLEVLIEPPVDQPLADLRHVARELGLAALAAWAQVRDGALLARMPFDLAVK